MFVAVIVFVMEKKKGVIFVGSHVEEDCFYKFGFEESGKFPDEVPFVFGNPRRMMIGGIDPYLDSVSFSEEEKELKEMVTQINYKGIKIFLVENKKMARFCEVFNKASQ